MAEKIAKENAEQDRLHRLPRFCELCGDMAVGTARRLIREGKLRSVRLGRKVCIPHSELVRIVNGEGLPSVGAAK
jgi:hypothetical protein